MVLIDLDWSRNNYLKCVSSRTDAKVRHDCLSMKICMLKDQYLLLYVHVNHNTSFM